MSLYECSKCHCAENTALSNYWHREGQPALCSECDPEIGKWHGQFPKTPVAGNYVPGPHGLMSIEQAEQERWAQDESKDADERIKRIGVKNAIECAFRRGWNYGAAYQRGELGQKPKENV